MKNYKCIPEMKLIKLLFAILFIASSNLAFSQNTALKPGESLEKIRAVVGNDIITQSDIMGYLVQFMGQDKNININDPEIQNKVLNLMIDEKLVIAKAIEDSIVVAEEEVDQRWEQQMHRLIAKFGSQKRIEDVFGMSIIQMKNDLRDDIRKQLISDKMKAKLFSDISVTNAEVEDFYKQYSDSIPNVPASVDLFHIVKNVIADEKSKAETYKLALAVRDSISAGGNFEEFAHRYSGDPGSAMNGGDLGWAGKGLFIKEFEQTAFNQNKGAVSAPIETMFGFHIIQTLDKTKDSVHARHILFKFGQSTEDIDKTKKILTDIKQTALENGNFEELAKKNSDEVETKGFGGALGQMPLNQIPPQIQDVIHSLKDGDITEPMIYASEPKMSFHILYRKRTIPEHKAELKGDFKQLEAMAINFKQNKLYQEWIQKIRKEMYWEIK